MSAGLHEDGARQAREPRHARAPSYECVTTAETMVEHATRGRAIAARRLVRYGRARPEARRKKHKAVRARPRRGRTVPDVGRGGASAATRVPAAPPLPKPNAPGPRGGRAHRGRGTPVPALIRDIDRIRRISSDVVSATGGPPRHVRDRPRSRRAPAACALRARTRYTPRGGAFSAGQRSFNLSRRNTVLAYCGCA